jgi:aminobenzoyl-glutamate transport protein
MAKSQSTIEKKKGFLGFVERSGNALPHPATLFGILALLVLIFSFIGHIFQWYAIDPSQSPDIPDEDKTILVKNLLSRDGLHQILLEMVNNYTGFAPLGIVMVALLGIGVAEGSGLINASIRLLVYKSPEKIITFVVVLAGILSNVASDLGYVLVIPIGAVIFHSLGRHPIAGMAAAFAGVSGGFSANLFIGTIDPLLAGISTEAAQFVDKTYEVTVTANYYFMATSTIILALVGTWVTNKFVEPRLGAYKGNVVPEAMEKLTKAEKKGLKRVAIATLVFVAVIVAGLLPENGLLRGDDGSVFKSPVLKGFIAFLFIIAAVLGIIFGVTTGKFKSDADVVKGMVENFKTLVAFLVLVFFAAQFVAYFKWSNLGLIIAIKGAEIINQLDIGLIPLVILFVILAGFINLFMGSASAKWALLGPVFIPMFMYLEYSPELSQVVFRIGDSITNMISPMMSFFALIIVYFERYDKNAGIGTLISTMLPYTVAFFVFWVIQLVIWIVFNIPLGPGAGLYY